MTKFSTLIQGVTVTSSTIIIGQVEGRTDRNNLFDNLLQENIQNIATFVPEPNKTYPDNYSIKGGSANMASMASITMKNIFSDAAREERVNAKAKTELKDLIKKLKNVDTSSNSQMFNLIRDSISYVTKYEGTSEVKKLTEEWNPTTSFKLDPLPPNSFDINLGQFSSTNFAYIETYYVDQTFKDSLLPLLDVFSSKLGFSHERIGVPGSLDRVFKNKFTILEDVDNGIKGLEFCIIKKFKHLGFLDEDSILLRPTNPSNNDMGLEDKLYMIRASDEFHM